jgi:hypothetical protein
MSEPEASAPVGARPAGYRQVRGEVSAYRAGVVLGLTLGEIVLLLLFALLLIIGAARQWAMKEAARATELETKLLAYAEIEKRGGAGTVVMLQQENQKLREEARRLEQLKAVQKDLEDVQRAMRRLPPNKQTPAAVAEQINMLAEIENRAGPFDTAKAVAALQFVKDAAAAMPGKPAHEILQEMRAAEALRKEFPGQTLTQVNEAAKAWQEAIKAVPLEPGEKPGDKFAQMQRQTLNARNQIRELSQRIANDKKGNVLPSCWANEDGKEESLFNVIFGDDGVELSYRPLPHRDADRAGLPIQSVRYNSVLTIPEFRSALRELDNWSKKNNCRFYVVQFTRGIADKREALNAVYAYFYTSSTIQPVARLRPTDIWHPPQ